jgi:hypothetical protein
MIPTEIRRIVYIAATIVVLIFAVLTLAWCAERDRARKARSDASIAVATGEALDKVASETPVIRQEQEEKQDAVKEIPGADDRLPDGFGRELERVRNGRADNPR